MTVPVQLTLKINAGSKPLKPHWTTFDTALIDQDVLGPSMIGMKDKSM
jgi:hypothetical protein